MQLQREHPAPTLRSRGGATAAGKAGRRGLSLPAPGRQHDGEPAGLQPAEPMLDELLARQPTGAPGPAAAGAGAWSGPMPAAAPGESNAPAENFIIPFDRNPLVAAGERVIFNANFTDPSPASYRLDYATTGGHFTTASGPTARSIAGLNSGNVDFFVPAAWTGATALSVTMKLVKVADGSALRTETWTFGIKTQYPTTMTQSETTGERALGSVYTYLLGPAVASKTRPFYQHTTVLERFGAQTLGNIGPADIKEPYKTAHGLTTAAAVSAHFVDPGSGQNGTFTVDAKDQIYDQHGGHDDLSNLVAQLVAPKIVDVVLPQFYEAKPGVTLGNFLVTRRLLADGSTWKLLKKPVP